MKSTIIAAFFTVALGFTVSSCLFAQTKSQQLTQRISINFPGEFMTREMGPTTMYNLRLADSTANFVAVVSNLLKGNGINAATLAEASMSAEFWEQAAQGFIAQTGDNVQLNNKVMKNINGFDVMEMVLEKSFPKDGVVNIYTVYILVDDVYSLNIIHTNRAGKADEKLKKIFFESLSIK